MNQKKVKYEELPLIFPPEEASFPYPGAMLTDPFGTWTGVPLETHDEPVQDADDL